MRDGNEQFCHMWISFSAISEGIYCRGTVSSCRMLSGLDSISANICKQYNNPSTIRNMSKHTFYWRVHLSMTIWLDPFFFSVRKPLSLFFCNLGSGIIKCLLFDHCHPTKKWQKLLNSNWPPSVITPIILRKYCIKDIWDNLLEELEKIHYFQLHLYLFIQAKNICHVDFRKSLSPFSQGFQKMASDHFSIKRNPILWRRRAENHKSQENLVKI